MSITIVAANLKTESGDDYLFLFDQVGSPDEFVELVENSMGEELAYVWTFDVEVLYGSQESYYEALQNRINELGDE